jgi:hypothetical protein
MTHVRDTSQMNTVFQSTLLFFDEMIEAIVAKSIQGSAMFNHLEIFR